MNTDIPNFEQFSGFSNIGQLLASLALLTREGAHKKKHASQRALESLKPVDVSTLAPGDRNCAICYDEFEEDSEEVEQKRYLELVKQHQQKLQQEAAQDKDAAAVGVQDKQDKNVPSLEPYVGPDGSVYDDACFISEHDPDVNFQTVHRTRNRLSLDLLRNSSRNGNSNNDTSRPGSVSGSGSAAASGSGSGPGSRDQNGSTGSNVGSDVHSAVQMPCGHIFGSTCIREWLKNEVTCPLCRKEVESEDTSNGEPEDQESHSRFIIVYHFPITGMYIEASSSVVGAAHDYSDPSVMVPEQVSDSGPVLGTSVVPEHVLQQQERIREQREQRGRQEQREREQRQQNSTENGSEQRSENINTQTQTTSPEGSDSNTNSSTNNGMNADNTGDTDSNANTDTNTNTNTNTNESTNANSETPRARNSFFRVFAQPFLFGRPQLLSTRNSSGNNSGSSSGSGGSGGPARSSRQLNNGRSDRSHPYMR